MNRHNPSRTGVAAPGFARYHSLSAIIGGTSTASKLTIYFDTLLFPVYLKAIQEAQESVKLMTFTFKTGYGTPNRATIRTTAVVSDLVAMPCRSEAAGDSCLRDRG